MATRKKPAPFVPPPIPSVEVIDTLNRPSSSWELRAQTDRKKEHRQ